MDFLSLEKLWAYKGPLLLLGFVLVFMAFRFRKATWIFAVWFPLIAASGLVTVFAFSMIVGNLGGSGPDAGFAAMGAMFVLLFCSPIILLFVGLLIACPRRNAWRSEIVIPALLGTGLLAGLVYTLSRTTVTLQVSDASGNPATGASFRYEHYAMGGTAPLMRGKGWAFADKNGRIQIKVFSPESIDGEVSSEAGKQSLRIYPKKDRDSKRDIYDVMYRWELNIGEPFWQALSMQLPRTRSVVLPVHLKSKISFEPLRYSNDFEGKTLDVAPAERAKFRMLATTLEGFDVLPSVAQEFIENQQIGFRDAEALKYLAQQNYRLRLALPKITTPDTLVDMYQRATGNPPSSATRSDLVKAIQDRLDKDAGALIRIALAQPCTTGRGIFYELRSGARSAVRPMLEKFLQYDRECQSAILDILWNIGPSVNDIEFLLASDNSLWAERAAKSLEHTPRSEIPTAFSRLEKLRTGSSERRVVQQCNSTIATLQRRQSSKRNDW